ncbi:MAG: hypothetical protein GY835_22810 [bacterium]|nr:hypothetical protein [bacterium]
MTTPTTHFFRLLKTPIDDKGARLAALIAALNQSGHADETYILDPADFGLIPGSPLPYWAPAAVFRIFREYPLFEGSDRTAKRGPSTGDDFRRVRAWWEVVPQTMGRQVQWVPFSKGGAFSLYYFDIHLLVEWDEERYTFLNFYGRPGRESPKLESSGYFFRPGITWPRRTTSGISIRVLPNGCIFADKGPSAFVPHNDPSDLLALLAMMNSALFETLVKLQLGAATAAARSYEVGIIQRTPIPADLGKEQEQLITLAREAHDLQRNRDCSDETTHVFCLPGLVQYRDAQTLHQASLALESEAQTAQARLSAIQTEIDDIVFDLYNLSQTDRALVHAEMNPPQSQNANHQSEIVNRKSKIQNLLMWCVGVAFGRWDARMALDSTLLPPLQGPFDPLPRCAPGALVDVDGLPPAQATDIAPEAWLRARKNVLDIPPLASASSPCPPVSLSPFPKDGILVDDPTHPADIVTRVRGVLALLWGERADDVEREACEVLGVRDLRDYFHDPRKGFFAFHIKRYSKSRRKAPIYWLLQSKKRNYAVWLYIHRLRYDSLYAAGRNYADVKIKLEQARLEELRAGLETLDGSARRRREREIERQQRIADEVTAFGKTLDRVALLNLPPDLNDGVVIGIAPLYELVPWKEAQRTWEKLVAGEYEWSTMAQRMREKGIVRRET